MQANVQSTLEYKRPEEAEILRIIITDVATSAKYAAATWHLMNLPIIGLKPPNALIALESEYAEQKVVPNIQLISFVNHLNNLSEH